MTADMGSLQFLPKIVGSIGWLKEITYTGREFGPEEALANGLVNRVLDTKEAAFAAALDLAKILAEHSPLAVQGSKRSINYSLEHRVQDSLNQIKDYNTYSLGDLPLGAAAAFNKGGDPIKYEKL